LFRFAEGLFVLIENFCFRKRTFDLLRFASPQKFFDKEKNGKKRKPIDRVARLKRQKETE